MNFPFVLNLTSLMAHAAKEAREAVAEGKSGKINFLGATQYVNSLLIFFKGAALIHFSIGLVEKRRLAVRLDK